MQRTLAFLCFAVSLWSAQASAVKVLENKYTSTVVNVGVLLQPWVQVTAPASNSGVGACGSATRQTCSAGIGNPDGTGPSFDLFLRRARLMAWGNVTKDLAYFVETDEPNLGKGGNFAPT